MSIVGRSGGDTVVGTAFAVLVGIAEADLVVMVIIFSAALVVSLVGFPPLGDDMIIVILSMVYIVTSDIAIIQFEL